MKPSPRGAPLPDVLARSRLICQEFQLLEGSYRVLAPARLAALGE